MFNQPPLVCSLPLLHIISLGQVLINLPILYSRLGYKAYEEGRYSPMLIRFSDVDQVR